MEKDSLFVIGRNIYQAACGGSNGAQNFLNNFMSTTSGFPNDKRKALLDGMLFEIFFDKEGRRRDAIKDRYFDEVFELQQYEDVKDSFGFIAESLTATGGDFYAVPGKGHDVSVTVASKKSKDVNLIQSIYIGGVDVLRVEDEWGDKGIDYGPIDADRLETRLSQQLVVPARLLKVTYTPARSEEFQIPRGWTVRKPRPSDA